MHAIATLTGVSYQSVINYLKAMRLYKSFKARQSEKFQEQILALRKRQLTCATIAQQLGISEETVRWKHVDVWIYPDLIFGIPNTSGAPIPVPLSASSTVAGMPSSSPFGGVEIIVLAADGHFYSRTTQQPADPGPWRRIDVSGFTALFGAEFVVTGDFLLALASDRSLCGAMRRAPLQRPDFQPVGSGRSTPHRISLN